MGFNVAIDGPAGAGKSTIAKRAAARLSAIYVDTGAMYRAMALYLLRSGLDKTQEEKMKEMCLGADISICYEKGEQIVLLNGEKVNDYLRTEEVSEMASVCSAVPQVREKLLDLQRDLARKNDVVMDGRDIGTTILPDAQVKIYLTASSEVRAKRRYDELREKGTDCTYEDILREIIERDERDMNRSTSPLRKAADAVLVDSSFLTIEEVTEEILRICSEKRRETA